MTYETFSSVYDEIMDTSLYQEWREFSLRHLPKTTNRLLELACGTGALAVEFAKAGLTVTGLDLSEEMLTIAADRALAAGAAIQFLAGNMLDLANIGTYDAVTCFSDSLCYMTDEEQISQVFQGVHQLLEENGTFLFDVHSTYQVDELFSGYSFHDQTEDLAFLWDSHAGEAPHSVEHFLTFFVKEKGELFRRVDELHKERTYPLEIYQQLLKTAGFSCEIYADFTDEQPQPTSKRWFFVCHKLS